MIALRRLLIAVALLWAVPAAAHTRSESHSSWTIDGALVHVTFAVADVEVRRLAPDGGTLGDAALLAYLAGRLGVSAGGQDCRAARPPRILAAAQGDRRAELQFLCPAPTGLRLIDRAFFDRVPTHVNFAQIQTERGDFTEALIQSADQGVEMEDVSGGDVAGSGFLAFVRMGVMHIFTGIDHMAFLLGLVLISRRLRDLVFVVTGFTIGHSLTLALAVTGIIRPHAEFIDALVALTIALIGLENAAIASRRPTIVAIAVGVALAAMAGLRLAGIGLLPPLLLIGAAIFSANYLLVSGHLRDAGRLRLVVTLVFGLVHGFGFAADLLESRLPREKLAEILVGFNLGVEIGQLCVVLAISGGVALLVRARLALPRPITVDVVAALLVGIGTYWFVGRSFA